MDNKYGAITEQGDMGLGFTILSESDQEILKKKYNENDNKKQDSNNKQDV